jgi:hypothetical protein
VTGGCGCKGWLSRLWEGSVGQSRVRPLQENRLLKVGIPIQSVADQAVQKANNIQQDGTLK